MQPLCCQKYPCFGNNIGNGTKSRNKSRRDEGEEGLNSNAPLGLFAKCYITPHVFVWQYKVSLCAASPDVLVRYHETEKLSLNEKNRISALHFLRLNCIISV